MLQRAATVATRKGDPCHANKTFINLTTIPCYDTGVGLWSLAPGAMNLPVSGGSAPFAVPGFFQSKQRRTAKKQRTPLLFLRSPKRRQPRVSVDNKLSAGDNL